MGEQDRFMRINENFLAQQRHFVHNQTWVIEGSALRNISALLRTAFIGA